MRKYFFSLIFGVLCSIPVFACLNGEILQLEDGSVLYEDYEGFVPYGHQFVGDEELMRILASLETGYKETGKVEYLSDKGLILIIQGKYQEAIDLYKKIEQLQPNKYSTASNLGTAYELTGNNSEALKWIEKAVKINSESHFRSEWIHVNILKAKIKGEKNITSKFLIEQDFGNGKYPVSDLDKAELFKLKEMVYYQLNERVSFVKPKDKIVAQLLFDLGNISYLSGEKEEALETYKMAKEYGFDLPVLEERMKLHSLPAVDNLKRNATGEIKHQTEPTRKAYLMGMFVSVFALIFSGLIVFRFRKKISLMIK
ncbi:tetratricopeptide repeat protein [Chryseobacterium camelliae]|uniref:Tetratricopeptide repeat protein n=1 Tax=Chryseobacterium camelliae TaxID=1265445 RepID=A0ABY7QNI1_9FLAO|nr:tetratricopeptide repeat protein [Chryseobacterium camelliae]WBV61177.1 tetratricopeptide repeat protein [Chryseobacterium camelliae]